MPTFFAYSVATLHERRMRRRLAVAQSLHAKLAPAMDYAGVFHDQQCHLDRGLYFRPSFKKLHTALRLGDCVAFIHLERCFECLEDMIEKANDLASMGIRVILADARLDTGTEAGKRFLTTLHWSLGFNDRRDQLHKDLANIPIV